MAFQYSVAVRNARLDVVESTIGTAPTMKILSGSPPASCASADSGTVLASFVLPSDWMADAASGAKAKSGTWSDNSADASGTAGYFRIYSSGGTCHAQGTVTASGGGGDLTVDNTSFATGQAFTVTTFSITAGNA